MTTYTEKFKQIIPIFFLYITLYLTYLIFSQGLENFFILDDFANLDPLKQGIYTTQDLYNYLTEPRFEGQRPISRLSFLIDDNAWPTDASFFKRTNILIHLLTGIFLFIFSSQLFKLLEIDTSKTYYAALTITIIWLLHPLNTSTVLYVVQRMAQLSTLFILIGLSLYIKGRLIVKLNLLKGYLLMSTGIGAFGVFAFLSKENGILLSLLALALEYTILSCKKITPPEKYWKPWFAVFVIIPSSIPLLYFATHFDSIQTTYEHFRDFSLIERLMTQSHVLIDYLKVIFFPQLTSLSLFHDDYPITRELFSSRLTLLNIFLILGLILFSIFFRKKFPLISFGILWFFIGHILESTVFPLEIYFEHRNYLSMIGPLFILVFFIFTLLTEKKISLPTKKIISLFLIFYVSLIMFLQITNTKTWGNYSQLITVWYDEHPESKRAGAEKIIMLLAQKTRVDKTIDELQKVIEKHPESMYLQLMRVNILCSTNKIKHQPFEELFELAKNSRFTFGVLKMADHIRKKIVQKKCTNVVMGDIITFLHYLSENPSTFHNKHNRHNIYVTLAKAYEYTRDLNATITMYDRAYQFVSIDTIPLSQAILLSSASLYEDALSYVNKAKTSSIKRHSSDIEKMEIVLQQTISYHEKK